MNYRNRQINEVVIAKHDYNAKNNGDLSCKVGHKFQVIDQTDADFLKVMRIDSGDVGYIPSNYVTNALETELTHNAGVSQQQTDILPLDLSDEIDRRDLKIIKQLGSGQFGTIFYGTLKGQLEVAFKQLKPGTMAMQEFLNEAFIMRRCRHDKVVKMYGVCSRSEPLLIVTEFMRNVALLDYLRDNPEGKALKLCDLIEMCAQIASGMSYLESIKLVHRDLSTRNILVGDNNEVKLNDFVSARFIEEKEYVAKQFEKFPIKWTAPEAMCFGKFSTKSDVWSYGILLFEMITYGWVPYPGMSNRDVVEQVSQHKYRLPKPTCVECPDSYYDMMLKCCDEMPENRPTFEYLYHFFDDYVVSTEKQKKYLENIRYTVLSNEFERKDLKMFNKLGSGNFGTVFYGTLLGKFEVAVKQLKPGTMSTQVFLNEADIMRRCRHEKLVKFYGLCSIGEPLLIVIEFVQNGALINYLRDSPEGKALKLRDLINMCAQIASGMRYLESVKLVHRDLAARNILVSNNNKVKVADFGLARIIEDKEYMTRHGSKFPVKWTAPEAALFGKYSTKSDVWSYGILLYEIITYGEVPYKGMQNLEVLEQVSQHKYRLPKPSVECPDSYYDMMLKCWHEMVENRPTFEILFYFFEYYRTFDYYNTERVS